MPVLPKLVGEKIKRREDPALIQGYGKYVDDVPMLGTLHAVFFRSPYAHAKITSLDVSAAKEHPGVVTVLTGEELLGKVGTVPCGGAGPGMHVPVNHALAVGGAALKMSVNKIIDKSLKLGAHMLDARPEDVEYVDGEIRVKDDPDKKVSFGEVAFAATDFSWQGPGSAPADIEPGLEATSRFEPSNATFPFGAHICVVEIDAETGEIELQRFLAVDDCGNVINPLIVDGQVHGGIAQGLAQTMFEEVVYDDNGQLLTGSLMDYAMPKAYQMPRLETDRTVTPTPVNPLGAKGCGEAGASGSTPAVANAIIDALAPFGVTHMEMPFKPEKVWKAMQGQGS